MGLGYNNFYANIGLALFNVNWAICATNVTHLHKTSHKSPNIKWEKIAFYLKNVKKSVIFYFHQKNIFWARFFSKYLFFTLF